MPYDLAIFGSGFAAHEIARVAIAGGLSVVVLEKGAAEVTAAAQALSAVPYRREPVVSGGFDFGAQVPDAFEALPRYIGLGGTSELWSGKWRRLDDVDLLRNHGGRRWPLTPEILAPRYEQVSADYHWPDWSSDSLFGRCRSLVSSYGLRIVEIFEEIPPVRLRERWAGLATAGAEIVCGVTLRSATFDTAGRELRSVTVDGASGTRVIAATRFVIACGGIESVHVSHLVRQASGASSPMKAGLPARYGGYMDHPKAFVGELLVERHLAVVDYFQSARIDSRRLLAFSLPESEIADRQLGNHTLFLWPGEKSAKALRLVINLEQFPEPENFVAVGPPSVSWRLTQRTWNDYRAFMEILSPRLEKFLGPVTLSDSPAFRGASHPAGTLPMSDTDSGVLDADCRFRDHDNLFCISSAAFPLAGSANPTMTVVALARRFADHARSRARRRP